MNMFFQNTDKCLARKASVGRYLPPALVALLLALALFPAEAHAQIIGNIEANIPFQFHAGDTRFPPGKYIIRVLDDSDLSVMEISSVDGSTSVLFEVEPAQASSTPGKTELIFHRYGNRYFLTKLFDEGSADGSRVVASRYEKGISQETASEEHVPAHHRKQQSD
jgi:hypothetical protein